jgi:hypothetical protein
VTQVKKMANTPFVRLNRFFEDVFETTQTPRPTSLVFVPSTQRFLASISPSNSLTSSFITLTPDDEQLAGATQIAATLDNPLNTIFDPKFNRWLAFNSSSQKWIEVKAKTDGNLDPDRLTQIDAQSLGFGTFQGMTVNPTTGDLFLLDSIGKTIVRVQPKADGSLTGATVSQIKLPNNVANTQGIAFNPITGNFQVLSPSQKKLYELSQFGTLVATRDVSNLGLKNPQSLVFAPSGDRTDNSKELSLYIADSSPTSGGIAELSFDKPVDLEATVTAAFLRTFDPSNADNLSLDVDRPVAEAATAAVGDLIGTINTAQFNPPSPDPSGITYNSFRNTLLISDGEVEEIPTLFVGSNLFESNLSGSLNRTGSSTAYTNEPTGVSVNPANGRLYVSDDNARRIFEINPGSDGLYGSSDDTVISSFSTRPFGSLDPEDVAFASSLGHLFISDGVNNEIYRVTPSGTFVSQFDTESSGVLDPEGVVYDPTSNHLFVVGKPATAVAEFTLDGTLVRTIDISAARARKPAGLTLAPTSQTLEGTSLYIVDRGVDNDSDPNENDGKVYEFSLSAAAPVNQPPVVNAGLDLIVSGNAVLDGTVSDDGLPNPPGAVTTIWSQVSGPGTVTFANASAIDTTASFSVPGTYQLRLSANDSILSTNDNVSVQVNPSSPSVDYYVSSRSSGSVGGVSFGDEDILAYDPVTGSWATYFDGSDVGLAASGLDVDAFTIQSDGSILLSLNDDNINIPGVGSIDDSDIVRFIPSSTGANTAGTYQLYLDGSTVGLNTSSEDIDAIGLAPDGRLVVSTTSSASVPGISSPSVQDEDLIVFNSTSSTWSYYFEGSDVVLTEGTEDIDATWIDTNGDIYLSTTGAFSVSGLSGDGDDIAKFSPSSTGTNTSGTFSLFWNGSANGFTNVDGFVQL